MRNVYEQQLLNHWFKFKIFFLKVSHALYRNYENMVDQKWNGSKLSSTLMVFLKEFFENVNFEKNQQTDIYMYFWILFLHRLWLRYFFIFNPIVLLKFYIHSALELKRSTFFISLHAGTFIMIFFYVCWIFSKLTFSKKSFRNTIPVSNSLDQDQVRHYVGPDLGPNWLQRLSGSRRHWQAWINTIFAIRTPASSFIFQFPKSFIVILPPAVQILILSLLAGTFAVCW